ncbi:MAG: DUF1573 domain-containing protein [candidate division Zixibacteria bacterium]|nr:DUF1573 domain-containing protein [candidate division Zixibacteria bacterium]
MKTIKLPLIAFSIICLITTASYGQPINPSIRLSKSNARIVFEQTIFNFGSITKGSNVTHNYWFSNTGTDTLIISKIKPTCGCTSTRLSDIDVAPGERSSIDIVFYSGKYNGKITKSIKLETNDPVNPYIELRFKAIINNPSQLLEFSPLQIDFETVPRGTEKQVIVSLTNMADEKVKIVMPVKPSDAFIKTSLKKSKLKPGDTTELTLTLLKNLEPGKFLTSISIEMEEKPNSRITIPISGNIDDDSSDE